MYIYVCKYLCLWKERSAVLVVGGGSRHFYSACSFSNVSARKGKYPICGQALLWEILPACRRFWSSQTDTEWLRPIHHPIHHASPGQWWRRSALQLARKCCCHRSNSCRCPCVSREQAALWVPSQKALDLSPAGSCLTHCHWEMEKSSLW